MAGPSFAAGTTAMPLLRLGFGAHATAVGEAFTARADDASAVYWNPAGLSGLPSREVFAEHDLYLQDVSINRLAYAHPLGAVDGHARKAFGVSLSYLSLNGIEARSGNTALPDGTFGASDFVGAASYSQPLNEALTAGVTGKILQQNIGSDRATGYAADFGVLQRLGRFRLGAALVNLGPALKIANDSSPLPQSLRVGASVDYAPVIASVETEIVRGESDPIYKVGVEYAAAAMLALRVGYFSRSAAAQNALKGGALGAEGGGATALLGLTAGVGLRAARYAFDYAFVPYGELGSVHKMSFSMRY